MTKSNLLLKGLATFVCLFLFAGITSAQTTKQFLVTKDSTWTIPTTLDDGITPIQVTSVTFEGIGGGGAGGFMTTGLTRRGGGGGGGGAYATVTVLNPTGSYQITPGNGGTNKTKNSTVHGSASIVKKDGSNILVAAGGASSPYTSRDGGAGALGGQASACTPTSNAHSGGNGGDPYGLLLGWLFTYSGGGGGAANFESDGNNALATSEVTGGNPGTGTMPAGKGGNGRQGESANGQVGEDYGAGGSGATAYLLGDGNIGGAGAPGVVRVTYTYNGEAISINNAETTICSGTTFDVALDITPAGFTLNQLTSANFTVDMVSVPGLNIVSNVPSYNTLDSKWHLTGTVTNSTSNTISCNLSVTVSTPHNLTDATATITVKTYGKLNGGVIAKDQFVCQDVDMTLVTLKGDGSIVNGTTTAKASGGYGNGHYTWYVKDLIGGGDYQAIASSDNYNHTPTTGFANYKRAYTDDVCGTVYAPNELNVTTVSPFNPGDLNLGSNSICANVDFTKTLQITEFTSPATSDDNIRWSVYWQESKNSGPWVTKASQTNLTKTQVLAFTYTINMVAADMTAGDVYKYRYVLKAQDCGTVPSNDVYTLNINNATDYTSQFPDVNITLWYGACDTSIATPTLTPTPASIVRVDELNRIPAGEHNIVWKVNDGCSEATYTQKVTVNYPACGATVTDANGREYQTVRVGCDCWIAENLKTNADGAAYYNEDNANEGFGKLYDWNAAVGSNNTEQTCKTGTYIQGVCPDGWALPTVAKFNNMLAEFGDIEALKSDDETTWLPGNAGTNTSGFGAKGAGYYEGMQYQRQLGYTYFWTCELNPSNSLVARTVELRCGCGEFTVYDKSKESKVSVRCVKVELND